MWKLSCWPVVYALFIPICFTTQGGRGQEERAGAPVLQRDLNAETVGAARVSSDGKLALLLSMGNPTLWEVSTGRQLREFVPPGEPKSYDIGSAWFSSSGRYVIAALVSNEDESNCVCVFESKSGRPVYVSAAAEKADEKLVTAAIAPDETCLLLGREDGKLIQVNLDDPRNPTVVDAHQASVILVSFSRSGNRVEATAADGTTSLWSVRPLRRVRETGRRRPVNINACIVPLVRRFSDDGQWMIGINGDRAYRWHTMKGDREVVFAGHNGPVLGAAISADGSQVVTAGADRRARVWDATTGDLTKVIPCPSIQPKGWCQIAFLPGDQEFLLEAGSVSDMQRGAFRGEWVERYHIPSGQVKERSRTRAATFTAEGLSKDGRSVVTVSAGGEAVLWSVDSGAVRGRFGPTESGVLRAELAANDRQVAVTSLGDGRKVWNIATGKLDTTDPIRWPRDPFYLSSDGRQALVNGRRLVLWDLVNARPTREFLGLPFAPEPYGQMVWQWAGEVPSVDPIQVQPLAMSADGGVAMAWGPDGSIAVWDCRTGDRLWEKKGDDPERRNLTRAALSPDGKYVAWYRMGDARSEVVIENIMTKKVISRVKQPALDDLLFSSDSEKLVVWSWRGQMGAYHTQSGRVAWDISFEDLLPRRPVFSADYKTMVVTVSRGSAYVVNVSDGKIRARLSHPPFPAIKSTHLLSDGTCVLQDWSDQVVSWSTGRKRNLDLATPRTRVIGLEYSPNSKYFSALRDPLEDPGPILSKQPTPSPPSVEIRKTAAGRVVAAWTPLQKRVPTVVSFGDNGMSAVTASEDGWLQTWGRFGGWAAGQYGVPVKNYPKGVVVSVSASQQLSLVLSTIEPAQSANATVYDLRTGAALAAFRVPLGIGIQPQLADQSPYVLWQDSDNSVRLYDIPRSANTDRFIHESVVHASISPNGKYVLTLDKNRQAHLWLRGGGKPIATVQAPPPAGQPRAAGAEGQRAGPRRAAATGGADMQLIFSQDSKFLACLSSLPEQPAGSSCRVFSVTGQLVKEVIGPAGEDWTAAAISPEGKLLATGGGYDGSLRIWDLTTGRQKYRLLGHTQFIEVLIFTPDGMRLLSASQDGLCRVWSTKTGTEVCSLMCYDNEWIVTTPDGRLDSSNLDSIPGISWVFPDSPFRALAPEVLLRDYFEPQLFERLMSNARGAFRPVRPLARLNRAQPVVRVVTAQQKARSGPADVTVEIDPVEGAVTRGGKARPSRSVHDLRLFRDGQLVTQEPAPDPEHLSLEGTTDADLDAWAAATIVRPGRHVRVDETTGKLTVTFTGVPVPSRPGTAVAFSAYAFNEDRVKSSVGSRTLDLPKDLPVGKRRAYVLCVGVSDYRNPGFDLGYAADDAGVIAQSLSADGRLAGYQVVPIVLVADKVNKFGIKEALKAALELLAGPKTGDEARWAQKEKTLRAHVPGGEALSPATPDDLVLVTFSGHGYTDQRNEFFLIVPEVGPLLRKGERPSTEALKGCVSSEELSGWLRRVDAGEMALVIDACHSAATVEQPWFKPGPMGSRGLGQLAYDKRMRVLAASQADDFALESQRLRHGLLTYALVMDGLKGVKADFRPKDGRITLGEWLSYGAARVPELHKRLRERRPLDDLTPEGGPNKDAVKGVIVDRKGETPKVVDATAELIRLSSLAKDRAFQTPALFDYARRRTDPILRSTR